MYLDRGLLILITRSPYFIWIVWCGWLGEEIELKVKAPVHISECLCIVGSLCGWRVCNLHGGEREIGVLWK